LPFQVGSIFKDPMTTAAAIDRLVHHSAIIELNIPNHRFERAKPNYQSLDGDSKETLMMAPDSGEPPQVSSPESSVNVAAPEFSC
jgi:hypothetical protein